MKLNRRKAMAAIAGGAAAAPQIARSTMENEYILNAPLAKMNYSENSIENSIYDPITHAQKLAQEKERLTKIANGDFSGFWEESHIEDRITQHRRVIRDMHVDTFKSVSYCNKERIKLEKSIEETKKHWMEEAKKRLLNLFNKKPGDIF